jgi:glycerate 2-kinase
LNALAQSALRIFKVAVKAADPSASVASHLRQVGDFRNIYVIGAGKAAVSMAIAAEKVLGSRIAAGFVNTKYGHGGKLRDIALQECGHPVPDAAGVQGAERIADLARSAGAGDLVVCLISGGASALMPLPSVGISLAEKQSVTRRLLARGATIHEFNCVRKHMSQIKGGQLARLASPASVLTLVLSDVIGDDLNVIGSGPTVPDPSTLADAQAVLDKYGIRARLGQETPKPGDACFKNTRNILIGSNRQAVEAAAVKATELGFLTRILSTEIQGEAREVARVHAAIAKELLRTRGNQPVCILSGGEPTVTLRGKGLGGRNQEFALAAAIDIAGLKNVVIFSAGTDGTDGPTDAAGAFATGETGLNANAKAALADNDSYHFFERHGGLIKTGPTGTNVMDIQIILVK